MSLRDKNGEKADLWARSGEDASHRLVPFGELEAALAQAGNHALGVDIPNTTRIDALLPHLECLALIAIAFPGFGDGRGFSIAKALRNAGFRGTLRAVGPLIADQFAYALACGFDEVELPPQMAARQPVAQWLSALGAIRNTYQRSHGEAGKSILDQRRAARKAGQ